MTEPAIYLPPWKEGVEPRSSRGSRIVAEAKMFRFAAGAGAADSLFSRSDASDPGSVGFGTLKKDLSGYVKYFGSEIPPRREAFILRVIEGGSVRERVDRDPPGKRRGVGCPSAWDGMPRHVEDEDTWLDSPLRRGRGTIVVQVSARQGIVGFCRRIDPARDGRPPAFRARREGVVGRSGCAA